VSASGNITHHLSESEQHVNISKESQAKVTLSSPRSSLLPKKAGYANARHDAREPVIFSNGGIRGFMSLSRRLSACYLVAKNVWASIRYRRDAVITL